MEFIIILIALAVERFYTKAENYRKCGWFAHYCNWMRDKSESVASLLPSVKGPLSLLILLAPIVIIVAFAESIFANMGSLFSFIFGIVVLIYSLGPRDISNQVKQYLESLAAGDTADALLHANTFFSGHHYKPEFEGTPHVIAGVMERGILLAFNNRILAVLFWFIILGPVGALTYRLTIFLLERFAGGYFGQLHSTSAEIEIDQATDFESEFKLAVQRLYMILGWIPARLSVVAFALAGSFSDTLLCWNCAKDFFSKNNDELIVSSGLHALKMGVGPSEQSLNTVSEDIDQSENDVFKVKQVLELVKWSRLVVVTIIALMTIVGWVY